MKTVNARELQKKIKECVDISQQHKVVITRHGKPAAVLVGVEGKDSGDVALQTSPSFWKLIEETRKETTLSMKELRTRLKKRKKQGVKKAHKRMNAIVRPSLIFSLKPILRSNPLEQLKLLKRLERLSLRINDLNEAKRLNGLNDLNALSSHLERLELLK